MQYKFEYSLLLFEKKKHCSGYLNVFRKDEKYIKKK